MWNRTTLRMKIVVLTAATLTAMCVCLTTISIYNTSIFYDPVLFMTGNKQPIGIIGIEPSGVPHNIGGDENIEIIDEIFIGSRNTFITQSIVSSVIIILAGTILSYFIAGGTLKPLKKLAGRIEEIDESNLSEHIEITQNGDEVARLTKSFNNMLAKLNQAFENKKLFASNAAHELKTPLTTMSAVIDVLYMDENPNTQDCMEVIEEVKDNINQLRILVQDLLTFNYELDDDLCEDIQASILFEKIISYLSDSINEKNISVSINGDMTVTGEKNLLERAFANIIQNAVKYNKAGGKINVIICDGSILIEDSGIGLPEESIPQIFDPFYCVDKSRSRKLGGVGLGLSIAKQILDKHGMSITVSSAQNKGTIFFIKVI